MDCCYGVDGGESVEVGSGEDGGLCGLESCIVSYCDWE